MFEIRQLLTDLDFFDLPLKFGQSGELMHGTVYGHLRSVFISEAFGHSFDYFHTGNLKERMTLDSHFGCARYWQEAKLANLFIGTDTILKEHDIFCNRNIHQTCERHTEHNINATSAMFYQMRTT